jgi:hypothetical protein
VIHYIDDSGSFTWNPPGVSLFASLLVPNRAHDALVTRFLRWKRCVIGKSKRELKGSELTPNQIESFTYTVLPHRDRDPRLTVICADTRKTQKTIVERRRDQIADQFAYAAQYILRENSAGKRLAQQYGEGSGWIRRRSPENVLWIHVLETTVADSVQHSVAYFLEDEHADQFEHNEIIIDRSFIVRERHIMFWGEWLRNGLMSHKANETHAFTVPNTWRPENHPFMRQYDPDDDGVFDLSPLFRDATRFDDSKRVLGLQIADICANICLRAWRSGRYTPGFRNLRPRFMGKGGRWATRIELDERSLHIDTAENHVGTFDLDEFRSMAAGRRTKRHGMGQEP